MFSRFSIPFQKILIRSAVTALADMPDRLFPAHITTPMKIRHGHERRPPHSGIAVKVSNVAGGQQPGQNFHRLWQVLPLMFGVKFTQV
jgi:hypothetical protein